jgi:hypothetical protein
MPCRFSLSFLVRASRACSGSCRFRRRHVWPYWLGHPPSSFCLYVKHWDHGVFRVGPSSSIARRSSTPTLDCSSETGSAPSGAVPRAVGIARFAPGSPFDRRVRPESDAGSLRPRLLRFCVPLAASPLESGPPGITTPGIFRPWPFSDLRRFPPPDSSPVLFHTDTTYGIQRARTNRCRSPRGPDRSILGTVPSGITRLGHADTPKGACTVPLRRLQRRPAPADETFAPCTMSTCHSPLRLQATDAGGGHIDNARFCKPTTGAGHHRPLQRLHCPNNNTTPFEKQAALSFAVTPPTHFGS